MGPLWEGKSFPAPVENLVPQYCFQSHSLCFCFRFFFDFLFPGEFVLAAIFYDFHWKPGFDYMDNNLVSCQWQMIDNLSIQ